MSKLVANRLVQIDSEAVVCSECELIGDVRIGPRCVVHTRARIAALGGPIVIGEGNLIEEQCEIVNPLPADGVYSPDRLMRIGSYNVFEVGSRCEALAVGDHNTLECKSSVVAGVELSSGCVVGAMCALTKPELLPERTVVFGRDHRRRVQSERPAPQTLQLDFLKRVLPSHHYLAVTANSK